MFDQIAAEVLTAEARGFIDSLHRTFNARRVELLAERAKRHATLKSGGRPLQFLPETAQVRSSAWSVAAAPADLLDRRVEITGPTDPKMVINALNSGARVFMADFEDSNSPTWGNLLLGQQTLRRANERNLSYTSPEGKQYQLGKTPATLVVRPRGWHMAERHYLVDAQPISASLFDFGLYLFHNHKILRDRQSGPYFYLPKLESHLEARLWNDVFTAAQQRLGIPHGTIRATVLIETIPAAFEMDEILYELRDHAAGLNAGRWDYLFSIIKKFSFSPALQLPDRSQLTMTVPFMRAYAELLVRTCHKRGAHAIGGMAAFIPSRRDAVVNERALAKVTQDKERESRDGFDGTWVAHPDLVPVAMKIFDAVLGERPHQKSRLREDVQVTAEMLTDFSVPGGAITEDGVRNNISVAVQYLESWLRGTGAVAIFNLMEDAATAEISRAQLWLWLHRKAVLADGRVLTTELYNQWKRGEILKLGAEVAQRCAVAAALLDTLVVQPQFSEFLTLPAYDRLI